MEGWSEELDIKKIDFEVQPAEKKAEDNDGYSYMQHFFFFLFYFPQFI